MGRSPLSSSCISFPLVSDSYLYDFCLYPCNLSFAGMCLEMVPFLLILPETCCIISTHCQRSSLAPGRCLIFYIFISHFFVEFHRVLHSGRPSQVPMQVTDLVFCRVILSFFNSKENLNSAAATWVSFQYVLVNPVLSLGQICASDILQPRLLLS